MDFVFYYMTIIFALMVILVTMLVMTITILHDRTIMIYSCSLTL